MALLHVQFFSEVLRLSCSMDVIIPQPVDGKRGVASGDKKEVYPVLYLLHGITDDHTIWQRRTSIERYVEDKNLIVVMPTTQRGFYTDAVHGYRYFTFIADELPVICRHFFPISVRREDTFAAGLSMGGYGAFKLGLLRPDKFAAVASLSGTLDMSHRRGQIPEFEDLFGGVEQFRGSENDLLAQGEKLIASGKAMPQFYHCCGTEDFVYEMGAAFRDRFMNRLDLTYEEDRGTHDWAFWDKHIQRVLDWLPIAR